MSSTTKADALLTLAILVSACGAERPTGPTPVQPAPGPVSPPGPPAITYHVSGLVVDEGGLPVAGAFVRSDRWSTVSDVNGAYGLTIELPPLQIAAFILVADEDLPPSNLSRLAFSVPVLAGAEVAFDIISTTPRGGTLTTALDPP